MKAISRGLVAALLAALATACAVSPAPTFHTLERPLYRGRDASPALPILVGPITLPETIDRAMLIRAGPGAIVQPLPQARWAQPLRAEIAAALAAHLAQAMDHPRVTPLGLSVPSGAYRRLSVDFAQLEAKAAGTLSADVLWILSEGTSGQELRTRRLSLDESLDGQDAAAVAAAHGRLIGRLAALIAAEIKPLP